MPPTPYHTNPDARREGVVKRELLIFIAVGVCPLLFVGGCALMASGHEPQSISIRAGELRAKYVVISETSGKTLASGLTPDTIPLQRKVGYLKRARYRVEITHPETGEVYTQKVIGKRSPITGWRLKPGAVEAPFK